MREDAQGGRARRSGPKAINKVIGLEAVDGAGRKGERPCTRSEPRARSCFARVFGEKARLVETAAEPGAVAAIAHASGGKMRPLYRGHWRCAAEWCAQVSVPALLAEGEKAA